jgi:hypothetical protein
MTAVVASRVVAEIYRGIDFPSDWASKPDVMGVGMARDVLVSVAVVFDRKLRPLAACWRVGRGNEKFVRWDPSDSRQADLLGELNDDLCAESLHVGVADLLATLVWAPTDLRPDQGKKVNRVAYQSARNIFYGWNIEPPLIVANADDLLMLTRRADDGLDLPVPETAAEMLASLGKDVPELMIVLPGSCMPKSDGWSIQRKITVFFGGLLLAGAVLSALVLGLG